MLVETGPAKQTEKNVNNKKNAKSEVETNHQKQVAEIVHSFHQTIFREGTPNR